MGECLGVPHAYDPNPFLLSCPQCFLSSLFSRVPCKRVGGIQFQINGNPGQLQVNIRNVADAGTIDAVWLKTTGTHTWVPMTKSWGEVRCSLAPP